MSSAETLEARLAELGIELPDPVPIRGRYRSVVVRGDLAYTSGALATTGSPLRVAWPGKVGVDVSIDDAKESARGAVVTTLANLRGVLGDLSRIEGFLQLQGYVNAAADFHKPHHVIGAASDLIAELFGHDMLPVRTAVGVSTLPDGASVVLDAVVAVRNEERQR